MYGIVEISGHQYKVKTGDLIDVEKLKMEVGKTIEFEALFIGGEFPQVGTPTIKGARVAAQIFKHDVGRKLTVFRRSPGHYRKKRGHRQEYTALLITKIDDGQGKIDKMDPKKKKENNNQENKQEQEG